METASKIKEQPQKTPLNFAEVRSWIRKHEVSFLNALTEFGDVTDSGRQRFQAPETAEALSIFTGQNLCVDTCAVMLSVIRDKFGKDADIEIVTASAQVVTPDTKHYKQGVDVTVGHVWLRFKGQDGIHYFIDPTYGQINRRLNRIVIDKVDNEQEYFHYNNNPAIITEKIEKNFRVIEGLYQDLAASPSASQRAFHAKLSEVYKSLV
ncbi:hypothetical protein HYW43_04560 [Candidatus Daviesbacteria bacterium]|nr:hypothetical protein [Candidatus Daviesbacteria bacterium]